MKKLLLLFSLKLVLILAVGCSNTNNNASTETDANEDTQNQDVAAYPEKDIEIYIPYSPGGDTDFSVRAMAEFFEKEWGVNISVINQTGGGGAVATESVASAEPDGYKLFYNQQALFIGIATEQLDVSLDDLTPIGYFAEVGQTFATKSDKGWDDLSDFVESAQEDDYAYGADFGATTHFMGGMLAKEADIDLDMVDGGGESDRIADLLGDHIDITVLSTGGAKEYQESGDFNLLAVLSEERSDAVPDVPTVEELGYDINFTPTHILYGPQGLDEEILEKWDEGIKKLVEDEEYQNQLEEFGGLSHEYKDMDAVNKQVEDSMLDIEDLKTNLGF